MLRPHYLQKKPFKALCQLIPAAVENQKTNAESQMKFGTVKYKSA